MRVAGVMSGTSLDGIDVAIVDIARGAIRALGFASTPYPARIREELLRWYREPAGIERVSRLNFELGELYARAVASAVRRHGAVELIGCHGQTVYHEGGRHTLQLGESAVLAERTGVPVVANFRARDIAAGGQGAPLVPLVDYLLFRHPRRTRVALNIGGIANITVIPAGARPEQVAGFDTGPGNMAIDALAREYSGGKLGCDRGGRIAAAARVDRKLLDRLLADSYYRRKPPKSAGREQFGPDFVARMKRSGAGMTDLIATATVLTAATIAGGVRLAAEGAIELIVSGGGAHNPVLLAHLAGFLPDAAIATSGDYGIDVDAKEAIAFAVLAWLSWRRRPGNLPSATGARRAVTLGNITA
ncbi:MAG: anhydro-N-acetylmuramic acid kinase [Bryobacteraceae bacterium]|jgi:anhydro-N-acetylmuramic acid kinase